MRTEILGIEGANLEQKFSRYSRFSVLPWWREKMLRQISIGVVWYTDYAELRYKSQTSYSSTGMERFPICLENRDL